MMIGTAMMNQMKMNGDFQRLFDMQAGFQKEVTGLALPADEIVWFQYHMSAMQEELGEVLKADKRWKTHRNAHYDPENKLEELADVFVTAINLALFSGFDANMIAAAIEGKIAENKRKLIERRGKCNDSDC